MQFTLRQVRIFESVARHGSMSRAAEELHLTQPAVSMQMKQLEDQIGVPLLELSGRQLYLTEAGEELRVHAQRFVAHVLQLQSAMDQHRGVERGLLRIAVVSTANYFLPPVIATYSAGYPGVQVSLRVGNRETVMAALAEHRTDIAITGEPTAAEELDAQRFMDNPLVVVASPNHRFTGLESVTLAQLCTERLVVREAGSGTRAAIERHLLERNQQYLRGCEFNSNEAIKQAVQAGLGLAVVSRHTIELELETGRLVVLPVETFPIMRHWYFVHRRDKRLSAAARAFRDMLLSGTVSEANSSATRAAPVDLVKRNKVRKSQRAGSAR